MSAEERPGGEPGPVVVFDGVCVLCSRSVAFLLRHAPHLRFVTMQSPAGAALMRAHDLDPLDPDSLLLLDGLQAWRDSDAFVQISRTLQWPWRALGVVACVPRPLRDRVYRLIARHRYRWFGRRAQCLVPDASQRDRFL